MMFASSKTTKNIIKNDNYHSIHTKLLFSLFKEEKPDIVIHLVAQAGVTYSIENPRAYLESNILGTFQLFEVNKAFPTKHLLHL